jgi:hypothetical protein
MLDRVIQYLCLFNGEKSKLSFVVPAVDELRQVAVSLPQTLTATGEAADAIATDFYAVIAAAGPRMIGPVTSTVQVVLLQVVHYISERCDPAVCDLNCASTDHLLRELKAVQLFFVRSSNVSFAEDLKPLDDTARLAVVRRQLMIYLSMSSSFADGTGDARKPGKSVRVRNFIKNKWNPIGLWRLGGKRRSPAYSAARTNES